MTPEEMEAEQHRRDYNAMMSSWRQQGMLNALGPKTHEERVEKALYDIDSYLMRMRMDLNDIEKRQRHDFWLLMAAIATTGIFILNK